MQSGFNDERKRFMVLNELLAELYNKISRMSTSEFTDLLKQTEDPNEKELYSVVFNTILQQQQRQVIEAKKF